MTGVAGKEGGMFRTRDRYVDLNAFAIEPARRPVARAGLMDRFSGPARISLD
jgi:hypothetical protein